MTVVYKWSPRGVAIVAAISAITLSALLAARQEFVPAGGDVPAYLLAARYNPLVENFDNPAHGWGYPAGIKLLTCLGFNEHKGGLLISVISTGLLVFVGVMLGFRYLPAAQAIAMAVILACHPVVVGMGGTAMSDSLFAAIVGVVVWLTFVRDSGLVALTVAAALAMFSAFVRGNGIVLVACTSVGLLLTPGRTRRLSAFLLGVFVCYSISASIFGLQGIPRRLLLRSGAGELAFATLDKTDTWRYRRFYESEYRSYVPLVTRHWRELLRSPVKTIYHIYDWWLIPTFPILSWFMAPGLFLWGRRLSASAIAVSIVFLGVQTTFLWSGRFQDSRHLLASFPFFILMAMNGILLLPRRVCSRRIPIRGLITVLVTLCCVGFSVYAVGSAGKTSPRDRAMYEAARWLRSHCKVDEALVCTRLNMAYYAHLKPLDYADAFGTGEPTREELAIQLGLSKVRWIAWIRGHSQHEFPALRWLERDGSAPDLGLAYRNEYVSIWTPSREIRLGY
jgi:hypothetical protein